MRGRDAARRLEISEKKNAYPNLARREDEMLPAGWKLVNKKCVSKFSEARGRDAARRLEIIVKKMCIKI